MGEIILNYIKELWPIFTAFLVLGGQWFWNNKRTKSQQKLDNVEINFKEIENMKNLFELFQNQFKTELLSKTKDNENLTEVINKLKKEIDNLSTDVKKLTIQVGELKLVVNEKNQDIYELTNLLNLSKLCSVDKNLCPVRSREPLLLSKEKKSSEI